jgi:hypothetical protein
LLQKFQGASRAPVGFSGEHNNYVRWARRIHHQKPPRPGREDSHEYDQHQAGYHPNPTVPC